jgi:muramoyltetrapeptide carboxypeptidase
VRRSTVLESLLLDFTKFKQHPKWIVGFSDITVLHNHLNTMGFKTIHGVMPLPFLERQRSDRDLASSFLKQTEYEITTAP